MIQKFESDGSITDKKQSSVLAVLCSCKCVIEGSPEPILYVNGLSAKIITDQHLVLFSTDLYRV